MHRVEAAMVKIGLVVSKVGAWLTRGGKKIDLKAAIISAFGEP